MPSQVGCSVTPGHACGPRSRGLLLLLGLRLWASPPPSASSSSRIYRFEENVVDMSCSVIALATVPSQNSPQADLGTSLYDNVTSQIRNPETSSGHPSCLFEPSHWPAQRGPRGTQCGPRTQDGTLQHKSAYRRNVMHNAMHRWTNETRTMLSQYRRDTHVCTLAAR